MIVKIKITQNADIVLTYQARFQSMDLVPVHGQLF